MKVSYRVGLYTLGCKVSLYETEAIAERFAEAGYTVCPFEEVCDVYVINTCTVTAESDAKSRKYIRRAVRKNPDAAVIVIGCYSQRSPDEVAAIRGVSAVIGTRDKLSAVDVADRLLSERGKRPIVSVGSLEGTLFEEMTVRSSERTRGYVKIEDGCECKCTYCAISAARGPVRSKAPEAVIAEVEGLARSGCAEVVLTGIETGSYGADFEGKYGLADLLSELDRRKSCKRIRLGSMAPELVSPQFIDRIAGLSVTVPHFHLSVQSASDAVLRRMKRRYNRAMLMRNIAYIKERIPTALFTADLMIGFPGETEADFEQTMRFVREARLLDAHVFAYSRREGTPAAEYEDQVPDTVKRERSARLIFEKNRVRDELLADIVRSGRILPTVFESAEGGTYTGHSDSYIEVAVESDSDVRGRLLDVIPVSSKSGVVFGRIAE